MGVAQAWFHKSWYPDQREKAKKHPLSATVFPWRCQPVDVMRDQYHQVVFFSILVLVKRRVLLMHSTKAETGQKRSMQTKNMRKGVGLPLSKGGYNFGGGGKASL